ncbi:MAG: ribonucleoside-diphosphate reductase, adenosylcobalamin-dependent, partial [Terricaulis sp.]
LREQEEEAKAKRRIGLGITGLADALIFCNARYGAADGVALTRRWLDTIRTAAYHASAELAAEKGPFPAYEQAILDRPTPASLDAATRAMIAEHGLRNGCLTTIAPTGTISLLAGNTSSGIEPVFAFSYQRRVRQPDNSFVEEPVQDYALTLWKKLKGDSPPPDHSFVSAQTLTPADHLAMQAVAQEYIDSSISKTVNCPEDISFEDFADVYTKAYDLGCKGCTTYRPNAVTGSILSVAKPTDVGKPAEATKLMSLTPRPDALIGSTYKIKWPESEHALYVTINDIEEDGRRRPFEIFINSKNMEHYAWTLALTRMISAVFRRGGDVSFVAEELRAVFDPRGGAWLGGRYVPSLLAAIGDVIQRHLDSDAIQSVVAHEPGPRVKPRGCPKCGAAALIRAEGCDKCLECGYSKCS